MELWTTWIDFLQTSMGLLATHFGFSEAVTIIALTLIARLALMPVSLAAAYRMEKNKATLARIKPQLEALREAHQSDSSQLAAQTIQLYRDNGVSFFDRIAVFNLGSQAIFGLGAFQSLNRAAFASKFLWIASLAKPDFFLTVVVGVLMLLSMALMPGAASDTSMLLMLSIPIIVSVVAVAALPSALGIYWATSNAMTVVQALLLRGVLARQRPLVA